MDRFKFRLWDSEDNTMFTGVEIEEMRLRDLDSFEFGEFMQYTGLKDKNGVEIYENDLVLGIGKIDPYPIIFDDGCFGYDSGEGMLELDFERHMEVVGNIHQNPGILCIRMSKSESGSKTPQYCCDCDNHRRSNAWRTDYCRAKQMLCVKARGGVVPTVECNKYEVKQ